MKIIVYAICKNESKFASRWLKSMGEADGIYVLDTGSTDDTVSLLRDGGARVTREIIAPWRFDAARNRSLELVPQDADVCVCTDLDEVFHPGWRKALEAAWQKDTTRASYRYTWNFLPDGSEGHVFWLDKAHARQGYRWAHPVHEVLVWQGEPGAERRVTVPGMQLDHHADDQKSRGQYLPLLELSVKEAPEDDRNMHYLGREYLFHGRYDDCIRTLKRHLDLKSAAWADERCASMRYIAAAYTAKGERGEAEKWLWRAAAEAPHLREPFMDLARLYYGLRRWEDVAYAAFRALQITNRAETYITDCAAWGSLPWDYRALGLYYTGRIREALAAAEEACRLSPADERLRKNLALIRRKAADSRAAE